MVLAVNFKQTALYFALPFVVFTLASYSVRYHDKNLMKHLFAVLIRCVGLGIVFAMTNVLLWWPWLVNDFFQFTLEPAS